MIAAKRDLACKAGTTFRKSWKFKQKDKNLDMTGWTARMQVRSTIDAAETLVVLTTENDGI